jgi:hypothetical protein
MAKRLRRKPADGPLANRKLRSHPRESRPGSARSDAVDFHAPRQPPHRQPTGVRSRRIIKPRLFCGRRPLRHWSHSLPLPTISAGGTSCCLKHLTISQNSLVQDPYHEQRQLPSRRASCCPSATVTHRSRGNVVADHGRLTYRTCRADIDIHRQIQRSASGASDNKVVGGPDHCQLNRLAYWLAQLEALRRAA